MFSRRKTQQAQGPRLPFGVITTTPGSDQSHFVLGWPRYRPFRREDGDIFSPPMIDLPMCGDIGQQYGLVTIKNEQEAFRSVQCTECLRALDARARRIEEEASRPRRYILRHARGREKLVRI